MLWNFSACIYLCNSHYDGLIDFFKKVHQLYFIVSFKIAMLFVVAEIFLDWMSSENDKSLK